ncbi:MAG: hypothetical protein Q4B85_14365, partial [Lachnospiraceae bacterium]|nr:hypothetical protein [Lachnospiraceae bacterium]
MIIQFLNKIIKKYIEHFNVLNNSDHAEYMKWEAAYAFQHFDFESPDDFAGRLKELCKICSVVIDNKASFPLGCLCSCASIDDEKANRVRKMFLDLFVDDKNDLQVRQSKIDTFIRESDALRSECGKNGYMYANTQTSVMAYLALRDPENNYLLSTSKARELASRIGFGDDWGTLSSFKLDVYYRFCDQLVDAMKKNQDLMDINKTRYQEEFCDGNHSPFHEDKELHLLAFDIIYTAASDTYGLGEEIPVDPDIVKK